MNSVQRARESAASPRSLSKKSFCQAGGRGSKLPRHDHPLQFPLKSYGFPGAETARKRFLLWEMGFPDAKISTRADVHAAGLDFYARGLRPSRALLGVDRRDVFSGDDFCGGLCPLAFSLEFGQLKVKAPPRIVRGGANCMEKRCFPAFGVTARRSGRGASATRPCP